MLPVVLVGVGVIASQLLVIGAANQERADLYALGERIAASKRKPLLVVGLPKSQYGCGDVAVDLSPTVLQECPVGGYVADVRYLPFGYKLFRAAIVSHVLEHLDSLESVADAWVGLWRVADVVLVAWPRKLDLIAWLHPDHKLWVEPIEEYGLYVEERRGLMRRGIIHRDGVISEAPAEAAV